jgi:selenocysteine lyase/cysteine desulfurase
MAMIEYDIARARSYFDLDKSITYLNHASHSPLPLPARHEFETFFDSWQKTAHNHDAESFRIFELVRAKLAGFIGAEPSRIGLSPHTTFGMNVIASGIAWKPGDNLILSEKEFPASVYPWLRLQTKGVEIKYARTQNGFIDEDGIIALTNNKTRLIHVSWVQFNNGNRVDLAKLGKFCRDKNILFSVDGIQGTGVVPIDVPANLIDHFTCGCQKWLLGPCGTGFYYLSERAEQAINTPYSGWLSVDWQAEFSDLMRYDLKPRLGPAKFEIGTYAFQDWRALNAALDILLSFKQNEIWNHIYSLIDTFMKFVLADNRFTLVSPKDSKRRSGIITFKSNNSKSLYERLTNAGFVLSFREGAIRVSPHFYNSIEEINNLIEFTDQAES